jgi:hypothetical protein
MKTLLKGASLMPVIASLLFFTAKGEAVTATASSVQDNEAKQEARMAVDGNMQTRWSSAFSDPQWLLLDLGAQQEITGLTLYWETARAKSYDILVSPDNSSWAKAYTTDSCQGSAEDIYFGRQVCRYVKLFFKERATQWGDSLWEVKVKGPEEQIDVSVSPAAAGANKLFDGDKNTSLVIGEAPGAYVEFSPKKDISFGAVKITWGAEYASRYSVETSRDKRAWKTVFTESSGSGGAEGIPANAVGAKYVRLKLEKSSGGRGYSIADIRFISWKETSMKNGLDVKRSMAGAEGYEWVTFTGCDGRFAPEPWPYELGYWVFDEDSKTLLTPETLDSDWKLKDGRYPISISSWEQAGIKASATVFADKDQGLGRLITYDRITVKNTSQSEKKISLFLIVKQNPLSEKWKTKLNDISYDGARTVRVNGKAAFMLKEKPAAGMSIDPAGYRLSKILPLAAGQGAVTVDGNNTEGAFCGYKFTLKPGEEKSTDLFAASGEPLELAPDTADRLDFTKALAGTEKFWKQRTNFELVLPDKQYTDCFYSSIYYMLIMMKGDGLMYPGPYSYKSFFLHDSIEMGGALDKVGIHDVAQKATNHYNVKVYGGYGDELGGSIFGYYEHYRVTKDIEFLRRSFPNMLEGCRLIRQLRAQQMTPEFTGTQYYGLVPKSVSQDNFTIPAYLYVDDWWAVMALKATVEAAKVLGAQDAGWVDAEYKSLLECTVNSIKKVMAQEKMEYMTGFADYWPPALRIKDAEHRILGDTQMAWAHRPALFPGQSLGIPIPEDIFKKSYAHYWDVAGKPSKFDGGWYVEYERLFWGYNVQLAHPMMFLGMGDVTLKNIAWSLRHQNCPGGWCEAMNTSVAADGKVEVAGGIIGDVPHGWTAAYYVHLLRNMIYRELYDKMVLLGCVPSSWLEKGKKISVKNAPTYFGDLDLLVESSASENLVKVTIGISTPPKNGYELDLPAGMTVKSVEIDGVKSDKFKERTIDLPPSAKTVLVRY